ncbi:exonuclease [Hafnia phage Enc34]|uniref:Exodeoxyribonuclease VIII n=1 Tax=Hafnia phage Enc34 TaxID=1150990 RepID=H6WYK2_9CAUD|nr:exonuclease [Hafnia phage Enc34]AFB84057.1 exodeoxyribonuclease VIII [Hafnia phage Enc34]
MKHVMLDLETMGKGNNAAVVAIGAVFFDTISGKTGAEFERYISLESAMQSGGVVDASTVIWWMSQHEKARKPVCAAASGIIKALEDFKRFILDNTTEEDPRDTKLWGNGIASDCVWIRNAFRQNGIEMPCGWWTDCDVRTVVALGLDKGIDPKRHTAFKGVAHTPLADAKHQVRYVSEILRDILGYTG